MDIATTLKTITSLAKEMIDEDMNKRAQLYATITILQEELLDIYEAKHVHNGYLHEKLISMKCHARSIAGLDDGNGHSQEQHLSWLRIEVNALKGDRCFNLP